MELCSLDLRALPRPDHAVRGRDERRDAERGRRPLPLQAHRRQQRPRLQDRHQAPPRIRRVHGVGTDSNPDLIQFGLRLLKS